MSTKVSLLIEANAAQAKSELDATAKSVKKVGTSAAEMGRKSTGAAAGTRAMKNAAKEAAGAANTLAAAEEIAARGAKRMGNANRVAAGQMGNLVAQFNDVGVMLAAGQSPIQLALQQGTQITQVIGPMGATGAVRALGGAFLAMLSPINLITIGSIAAGASLIGWLRDAWPAAQTLDDAMNNLSDSTDRYTAAAKAARESGKGLTEEYTKIGEAARGVMTRLAEVERAGALKALRQDAKALTDDLGGLSRTKLEVLGGTMVVRQIVATTDRLKTLGKMTDQQVGSVVSALQQINKAATPEAAIPAAKEFNAALFSIYGSAEKIPEQLNKAYVSAAFLAQKSNEILTTDQAAALERQKALKTSRGLLAELNREGAVRALIAVYGKDSAQVANARLAHERALYKQKIKELPLAAELAAAWDKVHPPRDAFKEQLVAAYAYYGATRRQSDFDTAASEKMLASLKSQNTLRASINKFGEGSVEVAALRAAQERKVFEATLETMNVSRAVKDELRAAFEEGQRLNSVSMSDGIKDASKYALELVNRIVSASGAAQSLADRGATLLRESSLRVKLANDPVKLAGALARDKMQAIQAPLLDGANAGETAYLNQQLETYVRNKEKLAQINQLLLRRGSGTRQSLKEADALAQLIAGERAEITAIRTLDPVQMEMLKNRKALAGATVEQRQTVEGLIAQRLLEQAQMDALRQSYDYFGSTANSFFDDLIVQGKSLNDVVGNLSKNLASAALQATILGTGPLASLFGTAGTGGLFGSIFGGLFGVPTLRRAGGGPISGPGGPTEDRVLMWGSNGKFMVNAQATAKHRSLLEAINAGMMDKMPGFATGGMVPAAMPILIPRAPMSIANRPAAPSRSAARAPAKIELHLSGDLDAKIARQSESVAVSVFKGGIEVFSNEALPHRVQQIARDEKAVG